MISKQIRLVVEKINENELTEDDIKLAPDSFFNEITIINLLDVSKNNDLLNIVCNKLKKHGILKINGIDIRSVCRDVYYGKIDLQNANTIFRNIKNFNTISKFKDYFLSDKWQINFLGMQEYNYFVEVIKL